MIKKFFKSTHNKKNSRNLDGNNSEKLVISLEQNVQMFQNIFKNDDTLNVRFFENQLNNKIKCCILFIEGMVNNDIITEHIIQPITSNMSLKVETATLDNLQRYVLISNNIKKTSEIGNIIETVLNGDTALLLDGSSEALIIYTKGWKTRPIMEPETEKLLRGPREGFTESLMINLSLIRRKLKTPDLKFKYRTFGVRSCTRACICYLEGIANKNILNELEKRLDGIEIDGVLDTGYIQEIIRDTPFTPFKTIGSSERPDVIVGKLLEGRIALILDGTPFVLTLPYLFIEHFQSSEDYYINFYFSSLGRLLRILGFIITISVPAVYVALTTFHQEVIPTPLILSIYAARQTIPFPTVIEILLMQLVFEILRETGERTPAFMGQALSIVGALVLGQAAVEARFISSPIVIVTALTGITGLMIPRLKGSIIIFRFMFVLFAAFLGLYGFMLAITGLLIHLCEMRSFGVPYMSSTSILDMKEFKDTAIRVPWWYMKNRQAMIAVNKVRSRIHRGGK